MRKAGEANGVFTQSKGLSEMIVAWYDELFGQALDDLLEAGC